MSPVFRSAVALLAGLVAVPFSPVSQPDSATPWERGAPPHYAATEKEAYLAPDALTYIRPGFNLKIASVTSFAPGQKPVVELYLTDDLNAPLDRNGVVTPGVASLRFIPAVWDAFARRDTKNIG